MWLSNTPGIEPLQIRRDYDYLMRMEQFAVTDRAASRIAEIVAEAQAAQDTALRIAVLAGGCSGFQYKFELDSQTQPDDLVIERGPARVVVDSVSLDLLAGSELDYTDELIGSHFAVRNPNAKSACGCGTSFSID
jgi:iron-sulfur cluster assembly accessory protein